MSYTVIQVENLWKDYRLGAINHHTLTRDVQSWWARMRGKEDPNSRLGSSSLKQSSTTDHFWALEDISFEVKQGDILGIIGRNGAGKSTLLKILSQITAPTKGEVRYKGRIASLLEVGTGFHPELTGRENVFLNGAILGMSKSDIRKRFAEIVAFAEVDKFIDTPVKRYSSGMYVRLAFAVAAHLEPEILIVDEVLAVGDAQFQKKCLGKMQAVGKEGRTVLFVSHNMMIVSNLCTRGLLLHQGQCAYHGLMNETIMQYDSLLKSKAPALSYDKLSIAELKVEIVSTSADSGNFRYEFVLDLHVPGKMFGVEIGIGIDDSQGNRIFTILSRYFNVDFDLTSGKNTVRCLVEGVTLKPDIYNANVYIGSRHELLAYLYEDHAFIISQSSSFPSGIIPDESQGSVMVEQRWHCQNNDTVC